VLKRRRGAKGKVFGFQREATASAIANRNTFLDLQPATFQAHHVTLFNLQWIHFISSVWRKTSMPRVFGKQNKHWKHIWSSCDRGSVCACASLGETTNKT